MRVGFTGLYQHVVLETVCPLLDICRRAFLEALLGGDCRCESCGT